MLLRTFIIGQVFVLIISPAFNTCNILQNYIETHFFPKPKNMHHKKTLGALKRKKNNKHDSCAIWLEVRNTQFKVESLAQKKQKKNPKLAYFLASK